MGQITITITPNSTVYMTTKEIYGQACESLVNTLSANLGTVVASKETQDASVSGTVKA